MNLKGWSKGKGRRHFEKHGKKMGFRDVREYTAAAKALAKKRRNIRESKIGNILFMFDMDTDPILILNSKARKIKTFYPSEEQT